MKTLIKPQYLIALVFLVLGAALLIAWGQTSFAGITYNQSAQQNTFLNHTFFTATTTSATSTTARNVEDRVLRIDGADQVTFYFSRGGALGANTGSSKFEVEVSPDGTNWYDFNRMMLLGTTNTASSTLWITAATSTVVASMDLENSAFHFVRCQVVELTDGEHTCSASVEY